MAAASLKFVTVSPNRSAWDKGAPGAHLSLTTPSGQQRDVPLTRKDLYLMIRGAMVAIENIDQHGEAVES